MSRFLLLLIFVSSLFISQFSWATFTFTLNDHFLDFGSVNVGDSKYGVPPTNLILGCRSDQGNRWQLQIRASQDLYNGNYAIPIKNFKYFGTYANSMSGTVPNVSDRSFSKQTTSLGMLDQTFYRSDSTGDQSIAEGTSVYLQFGVTIPETMPVGVYTTGLVLTMTE
jgi:hypothetical protein